MPEIGKQQNLTAVRRTEHGVYLAEAKGCGANPKETQEDDARTGPYLTEKERVGRAAQQVLLPRAQVPDGLAVGDTLRVFVYRDSEDRPIATTEEPLLTLGETAVLTVKDVNQRVGAFLYWGLSRDLLLPFHEQTRKVKVGDEVLVALYLDKSDRLCATMKVYHYLKTQSPYQIGDTVRGRIYEISGNFGIFVAVDDRYSGLIPKQEAQATYVLRSRGVLEDSIVGTIGTYRVTEVKEDGKLTLSARGKAYEQIEPDAELLREYLRDHGEIPFDDKAAPERIAQTFGLSKAAFKRAVGHLLKNREIRLAERRILPR